MAPLFDFSLNESRISRPYRLDMFELNPKTFKAEWKALVNSIDPIERKCKLEPARINQVVYTAVMSLCLCYDLWKPGSRKTPGTYFEIVLGSILGTMLGDCTRSKHVPLIEELEVEEEQIIEEVGDKGDVVNESVSTDIVFKLSGGQFLVIPAKITTRERIVQAFAHQRILDSYYHPGKFKSLLICVSETQRDKKERVKEICVPGTLKLFQKHLAAMAGIYYLDPPTRYLAKDVTDCIPVGYLGDLLATNLSRILDSCNAIIKP